MTYTEMISRITEDDEEALDEVLESLVDAYEHHVERSAIFNTTNGRISIVVPGYDPQFASVTTEAERERGKLVKAAEYIEMLMDCSREEEAFARTDEIVKFLNEIGEA